MDKLFVYLSLHNSVYTRRTSWPEASNVVPKESAAAMQGIFNVQDLFLSSEPFKTHQTFNYNDQSHVHTFHPNRNIGVVSPFQNIEQFNEDDKLKDLNSGGFNIIQIKETTYDDLSQNQNSIKSCILGSTRSCLGNYL